MLKFDAMITAQGTDATRKEIVDRLRKTADHIESSPDEILIGVEDDEDGDTITLWKLDDTE